MGNASVVRQHVRKEWPGYFFSANIEVRGGAALWSAWWGAEHVLGGNVSHRHGTNESVQAAVRSVHTLCSNFEDEKGLSGQGPQAQGADDEPAVVDFDTVPPTVGTIRPEAVSVPVHDGSPAGRRGRGRDSGAKRVPGHSSKGV